MCIRDRWWCACERERERVCIDRFGWLCFGSLLSNRLCAPIWRNSKYKSKLLFLLLFFFLFFLSCFQSLAYCKRERKTPSWFTGTATVSRGRDPRSSTKNGWGIACRIPLHASLTALWWSRKLRGQCETDAINKRSRWRQQKEDGDGGGGDAADSDDSDDDGGCLRRWWSL